MSLDPAADPFLNAVADDFTTAAVPTTGGATATVFSNDTNNGAAFAPADVTATLVNDGGVTGASIGADGAIVIPAGTAAGSYTLTYQICRAATASICDTASAKVLVQVPASTAPVGSVSTSGGASSSAVLAESGSDTAPNLLAAAGLLVLGLLTIALKPMLRRHQS
ncbi:hypothetical protein ACO2Q7_14910 [Rathayibacter sp. KR2-224]|uniref:hypothetical protein n=1 Tax=Rathayibacter sp. KR2-224 TaxID=3400913 RepID=UPI003BFEFDC2